MCLMLISSHEQLEIFAPTLFKIQPLISSILLAHPGRKEGSEWLWKSFLRSVKRELIWETFLKGVCPLSLSLTHTHSVFNNQRSLILSMDSGSADSKQICRAGDFFCKTCVRWSTSFEEFTKHIKCEKHTQEVKVSTFAAAPFSLPAKFCLLMSFFFRLGV